MSQAASPPGAALATSLRQAALAALATRDVAGKISATQALSSSQTTGADGLLAAPAGALPGRPDRPLLVPHRDVPQRSLSAPGGLAALIHALAHIEFNAINLSLDATWRFAGLPDAYYRDWVRVAQEEAYHHQLLAGLLQTLGHAYGDLPAHNALWEMAERTQGDPIARMALVPRTLEARGLDATPQIQHKLRQLGTPAAQRAVDILDIILRDEVGHVAIGNHWYRWLCAREGLEPVAHFRALARQHRAPRLRAPFNDEARLRAGFTEEELGVLKALP